MLNNIEIYRCWVVWNRNIFVIIPGLAGLVITSGKLLNHIPNHPRSYYKPEQFSDGTNKFPCFLSSGSPWLPTSQFRSSLVGH